MCYRVNRIPNIGWSLNLQCDCLEVGPTGGDRGEAKSSAWALTHRLSIFTRECAHSPHTLREGHGGRCRGKVAVCKPRKQAPEGTLPSWSLGLGCPPSRLWGIHVWVRAPRSRLFAAVSWADRPRERTRGCEVLAPPVEEMASPPLTASVTSLETSWLSKCESPSEVSVVIMSPACHQCHMPWSMELYRKSLIQVGSVVQLGSFFKIVCYSSSFAFLCTF